MTKILPTKTRNPSPISGVSLPNSPGRPLGKPNMLTRTIKEAIEGAFSKVGGEKYLIQLARDEPKTFAALLAKVIPTQITGADGESLIPKIDIDTTARQVAFLLAKAVSESK